jgi:hypothetical protein
MIHPDLGILYTAPESIWECDREMCYAIFAAIAFLNLSAEMMREQLMAVTDAQNRCSATKDIRVNIGTTGLIDTCWTARDYDPFTRMQLRDWCLTRLNVCVDSEFAYFPCDQMSVLPACVENSNLGYRSCNGLLN